MFGFALHTPQKCFHKEWSFDTVLIIHPSCDISDLVILRKLYFALFFRICVFMNGGIRDYVLGSFYKAHPNTASYHGNLGKEIFQFESYRNSV